MSTISKIGIGALVGVLFAVGYASRVMVESRETAAAAGRGSFLESGTRIASMNLEGAAGVDFKPLQTLLSVVTNLRQHYVDQLTDKDEGKMTHLALESMLASLDDPNTRFIKAEQRKIVADAQEGKFHGIGAILGTRRNKIVTIAPAAPAPKADAKDAAAPAPKDGAKPAVAPAPVRREVTEEQLLIMSVLPGSAAEKAGLKSGEYILEIDGKTVLPFDPYQRVELILKDARAQDSNRTQLRTELEAEQKRIESGIGMREAQDLLSSQDDKAFELTVAPAPGGKTRKVKVEPGVLVVDPVTHSMRGKYAHIRIHCFTDNVGSDFAEAMRAAGSAKAEGIVLDLRGVSGGRIDGAAEVAEWFIPGKVLATELRSRNRKTEIPVPNTDAQPWRKPVAVLVDGSTSRVPEVLAAALKENGAARVVGSKTYGDFTSTSLIEQEDGSAMVLTTGEFRTSKGGDYSGKGIPVDVEVSTAGDAPVEEAVRLLGRAGKESAAR